MGWKYSFENCSLQGWKEIICSVREDRSGWLQQSAEGMNANNRLPVDAQVKDWQETNSAKTGQDTSIWMLILGFLTLGGTASLTKRQRDRLIFSKKL